MIWRRMREEIPGCHVERSSLDSHANCWVKDHGTRRKMVRRRKRVVARILFWDKSRRIVFAPGTLKQLGLSLHGISLVNGC